MYTERRIKAKEEGNNERGIGESCSNELGRESYGGILMAFIEEKSQLSQLERVSIECGKTKTKVNYFGKSKRMETIQ